MMSSMRTCKRRLAMLWFITGGALFALMIGQSFGRVYGRKLEMVWEWFLPALMPTLSLMLSVIILDATTPSGRDHKISRFLFLLTFMLSAFYLAILVLTLALPRLTTLDLENLIKPSRLWMGPLQGLVAAALGVFFIKGEHGAT